MKKIFMAVIALMMTISASAQFYIYYSDGTVAKVDSISLVGPDEDEDPNPSQGIGVFSVAEDKQVTFSPSNLQYTQSTDTWSFAYVQWDYIGVDNVTGGEVTSDPKYGYDEQIGSALGDMIDLFGWSGSTGSAKFGVSTSTNENNYSGSFVDWGTNQIGAGAPNTWRTLTYDEWEYLLNNRARAHSRKGVAQVNGVNGLILLPDDWKCPEGIIFKSGFSSDYSVEAYGQYQTFTPDQWSKLETAGAVFLPASGSRYSSVVSDVRRTGYYWSATEIDSDPYCLYIYPDEVDFADEFRECGLSVRLVKDI